MLSMWKKNTKIKIKPKLQPYIYRQSTINDGIMDCIFYNEQTKEKDIEQYIYQKLEIVSKLFRQDSIHTINIPPHFKMWGKQFYTIDIDLFCFISDGSTGDLIKWNLNNVESQPFIVQSNLICQEGIVTHNEDKLHIIGHNNHFIFQNNQQIACIQTSFGATPLTTSHDNEQNIIMLDEDGHLWFFNIKTQNWLKCKLNKILNVNWCTRIAKTKDKKHLILLSGGEIKEAISMDQDNNFLDKYHKFIYIISLPLNDTKSSLITKSSVILPVALHDCQISITCCVSSKNLKLLTIIGFLRKNINVQRIAKFPNYLSLIVARYFIFEFITIYTRECTYSINVDDLFT